MPATPVRGRTYILGRWPVVMEDFPDVSFATPVDYFPLSPASSGKRRFGLSTEKAASGLAKTGGCFCRWEALRPQGIWGCVCTIHFTPSMSGIPARRAEYGLLSAEKW